MFKSINTLIVNQFYAKAHFKKWKGFRVLAMDGSTAKLPGNHSSLKNFFSRHGFGPKADVKHWMSRVSFLYDVFNGIVIDAQMASFNTGEGTLANRHMAYVKKGDLLIFDRGYASSQRMFQLMAKGAHFLFRMKDNWWKCVEEFQKNGQTDQIVTLTLPKKYHYLLKKHPHLTAQIQIRLIKKTNRKGESQVFATSLIDTKIYSCKSILNLYKQRWAIEEAYKMIKSRMELIKFSGITSWAIQQDFYAKTALISLNNALTFDIKPAKPKKQPIKRAKQKRNPIINRTYAMHLLKKLIINVASGRGNVAQIMMENFNKIRKKVEYSRADQYFKRIVKPDTKYAGNYRSV